MPRPRNLDITAKKYKYSPSETGKYTLPKSINALNRAWNTSKPNDFKPSEPNLIDSCKPERFLSPQKPKTAPTT